MGVLKVFEIDKICYSYPDGTEALRNVSFCLNEGETLGLVGANGSGKSTLLMLIMGCLTPLDGAVLHRGSPLRGEKIKEMRRETGFLFQDPDDQLFLPTVGEDVAFGPRNLGLDESEVTERVREALEAVGMAEMAEKAPWRLSGGEKTLAALAGLFAMEPKTLLLDEPTSGLDPRSRRSVMSVVRNKQVTSVIATHDLDMVLDICDRVIVLKDGVTVHDGPVPGVLTDEKFMLSCGLELPLSCRTA